MIPAARRRAWARRGGRPAGASGGSTPQCGAMTKSRMPEPYIKLNPADAAKLGVNAGAYISFSYDGQTISLPLQLSEGLTAGQVGLPMGMPGIAPVLAGARLENLQEAKA